MEKLTCLLDPSILIQCFRAADKSRTFLASIAGTRGAAISAITLMELEFGTLTAIHRVFLDYIVRQYQVLQFDARAAEFAGDIYRRRRARNLRLDVPDLMIAAVAVANDLPLATLNEAHFARVPGPRLFKTV